MEQQQQDFTPQMNEFQKTQSEINLSLHTKTIPDIDQFSEMGQTLNGMRAEANAKMMRNYFQPTIDRLVETLSNL